MKIRLKELLKKISKGVHYFNITYPDTVFVIFVSEKDFLQLNEEFIRPPQFHHDYLGNVVSNDCILDKIMWDEKIKRGNLKIRRLLNGTH